MELDKRVVAFIRKHNVLTLATATLAENGTVAPYCANMFYEYLQSENLFVFTSGYETRHIAHVQSNALVGGSIVLESKIVGKLQGLQFQGRMLVADAAREQAVRKAYLLRYPFAAAMKLDLWIIEPTFMKFTDNQLGFGKKIIWNADE